MPHRQLAIVRAWWPFLVASVLLASAAAYLASGFMAKSYEARATLIVGQSLSGVNPDYSQLLASERLAATYATVATTRPLLQNVINDLGLPTTPEELSRQVRAGAALDSTLLTISVQDADAERAARTANALANQLISASPALQGRGTDIQEAVDVELRATQDQVTATQAEVESLLALSSRTADQDARLDTLRARLVSLRSSYATLLAFSTSSASNLLTVVEPAVVPDAPISPRPLLNAQLAALAGLLFALAVIFLVESLRDAIKDHDDVQETVGLPTLGTIVNMRRDRTSSEIHRLVTILYPRSQPAEAFRTLRTNVGFSAIAAPIQTLLVTSPMPGEGKTVTAANLAVAFAQAGASVLLVDADLRKPGLHTIFGLPNLRGLTTLLSNERTTIDSAIQATEQDGLQILATGPLPPNPAELLGSQRMRTIIDRLRVGHDIVIFDSPPAQVVTDPAMLSSLADATLIVIRAGHTRRATLREARDTLAKGGGRVVGVVLNGVAEAGYSTYRAYYEETFAARGQEARSTSGTDPSPSGWAH